MRTGTKIARRYCCPHCLRVQPKSPGWVMLASNADDCLRGAYHLDVLERLREMSCPVCRHPLDPQRMIQGDYDYHDRAAHGASLTGVILALGLHWIGGLDGWTSIGSAVGLALILGMWLSRRQKRHIRERERAR